MGSKGSKGSSTQAQTQNQNQQQFQTQAQDQATQSQTNTAQQQALTQAQQTAQQTAQNQQGQSTYNANPLIGGAAGQALTQAQQAAQTPFNLPVAPVAGFTPDQLQAFQQTQQQQGIAQPYYNQAQDLYNQSAAPISGAQISQYMNPYASSVMANLQESQGQQMNDVTGRLTQQAGGVGGSRIGVAQAELARQQNLATGQTMAGIYGSALSAAQQDAQRQQAAAYGVGNLGGAAQNAAMQGTQALLGTGSLQQQQQQAQLNAPYQNQLAQLALPYQQAQYLAGITGGLSGALGGTTNTNQTGTGSTTGQMTGTSLGNTTGQTTGSTNSQGQSVGYGQTIGNMNANTVNTPAQPSWLSQLAGLGTAGAGLYGALGKGAGGYNVGGGNEGEGGTPTNPAPGLNAGDYEAGGFARGGRHFAEGGDTSDTTGDASWMGSDPTVPKVEIQSSHAEHPSVPSLDVSPHSGFVPMATPPSVPTPAAPKNDPIVPMQMKTLNMTPIQPQSSGSGSSFLGDLASVAKSAAAIIPLLAQGGAVSAANPYQSYDGGGIVAAYPYSKEDYDRTGNLWYPRTPSAEARRSASPDDLAVAAQIKHDRAGFSPGQEPSAFVGKQGDDPIPTTPYAFGGRTAYADGGNDEEVASADTGDTSDFGAGSPTEAERMRGIALLKMAKEAGAKEAQSDSPVGNIPPRPDFANAFAPSAKMGEMPTDQAAGYLGAVRTDPAADDRWRRGVNVQQNQKEIVPDGPRRVSVQMPDNSQAPPAPEPKATGLAAVSPAAAALAEKNKKDMMGNPYGVYDMPYPDLNHKEDVSRNFARSPWMALIAAGAGMMGGSSPYAGVNIGKGLTSGVEYLDKQRTASREEETVNQRAKQLGLQADKFLREYTQLTPNELINAEQKQTALEQTKWQLVYDPNSGKPFWTKPGETSVPAIQGAGPPGGGSGSTAPAAPSVPPVGGAAPPVNAPPATAPAVSNAPLAGNQPISTPGQFAYKPPSADPASGPGPMFNPKTGTLSAEHIQGTGKAIERADKAGEAANDASVQLGHLEQALGQIDALKKEAGGMLQTGAYAKQRFAIAKTINTILQPFGVAPIDPALIGSAEEAGKVTTRLGFALSRTLGAREAQQIVQQAIEANPGIENTPEGRRYIISTIRAGITRQQDYQRYVHDYRRQWRSAVGAEEKFNQDNPPEKYIARVGVENAPPEFSNPAALNNAIQFLRSNSSKPEVVQKFNKIYHGTASYFLKNDPS